MNHSSIDLSVRFNSLLLICQQFLRHSCRERLYFSSCAHDHCFNAYSFNIEFFAQLFLVSRYRCLYILPQCTISLSIAHFLLAEDEEGVGGGGVWGWCSCDTNWCHKNCHLISVLGSFQLSIFQQFICHWSNKIKLRILVKHMILTFWYFISTAVVCYPSLSSSRMRRCFDWCLLMCCILTIVLLFSMFLMKYFAIEYFCYHHLQSIVRQVILLSDLLLSQTLVELLHLLRFVKLVFICASFAMFQTEFLLNLKCP